MQRFCHRTADIAFRLGIPRAAVTADLAFDYELGYMDEGACDVWPRWPDYLRTETTAPAVSALGAYTIYGGER